MAAGVVDHGRIVRGVYDSCLNPSETELPFQRVVTSIELHDAQLCADLDLTQQLWRLAKWPLSVQAGVDDYLFEPPDFGRAVIAEVEPTGDFRARRRVFITDITDQEAYSSSYGYFTGLWFGLGQGFPVDEVGFYRQDGAVRARVSPMPGYPFRLMISYEPGPKLDVLDDGKPGSIEAVPTIGYPLLVNLVSQDCLAGLMHKPEPVIRRKLAFLAGQEEKLRLIWLQGKGADNQEDNSGIIEGFLPGGRRITGGYVF